jgi:aminoglycoside phosphotransferase
VASPTIDPSYIQSLLPENLRNLMGETIHWQQIDVGRSGDSCFRVTLRDGSAAFLKTHASSIKEYFSHEIAAISWLSAYVTTPKIVAAGKNDHHHFLLTSALSGRDLAHCVGDLDSDDIVKICANSMRTLIIAL